MIKADFHNHSTFSSDAKGLLEDNAAAAIKAGLSMMCVTEHHDMDFPTGEFCLDTAAYKAELFRLKERLAGRLELLFGVELGVMDYLAPRLCEYVKSEPFDFVIASTHLVDKLDPYEPDFFGTYGDRRGMERYFECTLDNIRAFDDFDVYGHLDYAVRYTQSKSYSPADYGDIIDEILRLLISKGKGIELNTAGLKYGLGYAHPHPDVLKRYRELGGEIITIGSDGHCPENIAYDFQKVPDILQAAGFDGYYVFRARKPYKLPL